jgi:alkaline phosphatase D
MSLGRRRFLGVSAGVIGTAVLGRGLHPAIATVPEATHPAGRAAATGVDTAPPPGWDYPAVVELLPFGHGVASGDPLADRVILWTRLTVPDARGWDVADPQGLDAIDVRWVVARDPALADVVAEGNVTTTRAVDWTVKVDAAGLSSATTYYYAFRALGTRSPIGRTRTAPAAGDAVTELRFAHAACTSWWSTNFHFYRRIAERNDLDLFLHAGDHVYGFVDDSQWYRARNGIFDETYVDFRTWTSADECRRRYALYYSDPDLLAAHLALPWCVIPDNHDLDDHAGFSRAQAAEVFWEWTPCRPPAPGSQGNSGSFAPPPGPDEMVAVPRGPASELNYRHLPYGDLADVICLDIRTYRSAPSAPSVYRGSPPLGDPSSPAEDDLLGPVQEAWLQRVLLESAARGTTFRVLVNSVNMSQVKANVPLQEQLASFGVETATSGAVYPNGWDQWPASRRRLYGFLRRHGIVDNIVLSGDAHGWFAADLVEDNQPPNYEPLTGGGLLGVVGIEVQPAGGGRVNLQGTIARQAYEAANGRKVHADYENYAANWYPRFEAAARAVEAVALAGNPNLLHLDWRTYGYGLAHLTGSHALVELWRVPMPEPTDSQHLDRQFRTDVGAPHLQAVEPQPSAGSRVAEPAPTPATTPVRAPWS